MKTDRDQTPDIARTMAAAATKPQPTEPVRERVADRPPDGEALPIFVADEATGYRTRWDAIQTGFVDEPRRAVEEADALVAQVIKRLSDTFSEERTTLERQWDRGDEISTEDLRTALQKYRTFFERLLTI